MENMKKAGKSFEYGVEADNNPAKRVLSASGPNVGKND
jgi:hypothetical protein